MSVAYLGVKYLLCKEMTFNSYQHKLPSKLTPLGGLFFSEESLVRSEHPSSKLSVQPFCTETSPLSVSRDVKSAT